MHVARTPVRPEGGDRVAAPFEASAWSAAPKQEADRLEPKSAFSKRFQGQPLTLNGQGYLPHLQSRPPSLGDARSCSMVAAWNVVDFRLRARREFTQNVGWYHFVGVADDVP
jgi:hypothetical protein